MRSALSFVRGEWRRKAGSDSGQTVLIVAGVLMGVALGALAVFLNLDAGQRIINRLKAGNAAQGQILQSVLSYALNGAGGNGAIPCPSLGGASPTGVAGTPTNGACPSNTGALPWATLGISKDQAIDAYGNYYTYVVPKSSVNLCKTVTSDYTGSKQYTGTVDPATASLVIEQVQNGGTPTDIGQRAPFAIVGHGPNGFGAISSNGTSTGSASSTAENDNCDPNNANCTASSTLSATQIKLINGVFAGSTGANAFDDQVLVPSTSTLQKACQSLTSTTALNATLTDDFQTSASNPLAGTNGLDATKYSTDTTDVKRVTDVTSSTNKVAQFQGTAGGVGANNAVGAILATNPTTYNFDPRVHPLYISAKWTPQPGVSTATTAGMSIATRVSSANQHNQTDYFDSGQPGGITIRYYSTGTVDTTGQADNLNSISIVNDANNSLDSSTANNSNANDGTLTNDAPSSTTYHLIVGKSYLIEAYDDGTYVWGRITQTDDTTNTVTVGPYLTTAGNGVDVATNADLNGANQVAFIGGANTNYLDNIVIGLGQLVVNTDGLNGYVTSNTNLAITGDITLEAWIRPHAYPTTAGTIMAEASGANCSGNSCANSFRLSLTSSGHIAVDLSGATSGSGSFTFGAVPLNEWSHVAVALSGANLSYYFNGVLAGSETTNLVGGVNAGTANFTVAADSDNVTNLFNGDISDVRVWSTQARSAQCIGADYNQLIGFIAGASSVVDATANTTPATTVCAVNPNNAAANNNYTLTPTAALVLNWKFDADPFNGMSINSSGAESTGGNDGVNGSVSGALADSTTGEPAHYVATLANYVRPFADAVCPTGTIAGVYECDFRVHTGTNPITASSLANGYNLTIPANLNGFHAKVWGAGGGGFSSTGYITGTAATSGGGGGFTSASVYNIGGNQVEGQTLTVFVGTGGTGVSGASIVSGAGGGGASGLAQCTGAGCSFSQTANTTPSNGCFGTGCYFTTAATSPSSTLSDYSLSLAAGGGGGASYSDNSLIGVTTPATGIITGCPGTVLGVGCGQGGGGGGPFNGGAAVAAGQTIRSPDNQANVCGGAGGDNLPATNPPDTPYCGAGGVSPVDSAGASGGGTAAGGASLIGAGGNGYDATAAQGGAGGGGGGGGVSTLNNGSPTAGGGQAGGFENLYQSVATISGSASILGGDTLSITFNNLGHTYPNPAYTAAANQGAISIATAMASLINTEAAGDNVSASADGTDGNITILYASAAGATETLTANVAHNLDLLSTLAMSFSPANGTFTAESASNGFGGGGGSGYADANNNNVINANGAIGLPLTPGGAASITATIGGTVTANDTISLTLTNPNINFNGGVGVAYSTTAYQVAASDTASSIAASVAAILNADAHLQAQNISAESTGSAITIYEGPTAGSAAAYGNLTSVTSTVTGSQTETVTLAPLTATAGKARMLGEDIYAAPSYAGYVPGYGNTGSGGALKCGGDSNLSASVSACGAVVILW